MMVTLAVERWWARAFRTTMTEKTFGEVQGVAVAVGPQAEKVTVPVGDPLVPLPVTVAVSTAVLPKGMLELLSAVVRVGATRAPVAALTPAVPATTSAASSSTVAPWTEYLRIIPIPQSAQQRLLTYV
jgi:hypothetical protein